jgi:tRNA 2-thiouridine synthesizing protein E
MLQVNGREIAVDDEGFLLNPDDWNMDVARHIARDLNIEMTEQHYDVVHFVRNYYEQNQVVPEARTCLQTLGAELGKDVVTRKFLYQLFPYGYGQQACKIAGMRKPLKLMLDV